MSERVPAKSIGRMELMQVRFSRRCEKNDAMIEAPQGQGLSGTGELAITP